MPQDNNIKSSPKRRRKTPLKLPPPRIWTLKHLMDFLGVSISWVYKRTMENAEDPIPRISGLGRLKFDTENPDFRDWMRRHLGYPGSEDKHE